MSCAVAVVPLAATVAEQRRRHHRPRLGPLPPEEEEEEEEEDSLVRTAARGRCQRQDLLHKSDEVAQVVASAAIRHHHLIRRLTFVHGSWAHRKSLRASQALEVVDIAVEKAEADRVLAVADQEGSLYRAEHHHHEFCRMVTYCRTRCTELWLWLWPSVRLSGACSSDAGGEGLGRHSSRGQGCVRPTLALLGVV